MILLSSVVDPNISDRFISGEKRPSGETDFAHEEKGSDCVQPFVALQKCIQTNPNAFPKDVLENDEAEAVPEKPVEDYKMIPPGWAVDSPSASPRQKL
nr:mitochondrial intermembrane space import and assembly protein 40 homolog [Tanacetum cinerariifolium]